MIAGLDRWESAWFERHDKKARVINPSAMLHWNEGTLLVKRGLYVYWQDVDDGALCALWLGYIDASTQVNFEIWYGQQEHERGIYGKKTVYRQGR